MRHLIKLLIVASIAVMIPTAVAAAAQPGVLSDAEYQQLVTLQNQVTSRSLKTLGSFERAQRACVHVHPVSALVGAARADCRDAFTWLEVNVRIVARLKVCAHRSSEDARLGCLLPDYRKLAASVRGIYHADAYVTRLAIKRRLTKDCVKAVGDTPKALVAEAKMAKYAGQLVSAITRRDLLAAQKYGGLYDAATAEVEQAASDVPMTACAHDRDTPSSSAS